VGHSGRDRCFSFPFCGALGALSHPVTLTTFGLGLFLLASSSLHCGNDLFRSAPGSEHGIENGRGELHRNAASHQ
jgi:hypothetical protein